MLATTQDKQAAKDKLYSLIEQGKQSAITTIEHVLSSQPVDEIPRGGEMRFTPSASGVSIHYPGRNAEQRQRQLHRNAVNQMAQVIDMPMKYLDSLEDQKAEWSRELLAHNLQTVFNNRFQKQRYLLRSVQNEVRGFLSDKYRRIDSRPVVAAFVEGIRAKGALAYDGVVTDTKVNIKGIYPEVYEVTPGELIAFGISLENSDFGNGALSVREYVHRIWCTNLAIFQETMRQVHLGKRLDDNVVYSQRTYELDSEATVSALKDVITNRLDAGSLDQRVQALQAASEKTVTFEDARTRLKKLLNKGEAEDAIKAFESRDTHNLPAGESIWRLSNAISWIAGQDGVAPERRLDLMKIAGEVLPTAA